MSATAIERAAHRPAVRTPDPEQIIPLRLSARTLARIAEKCASRRLELEAGPPAAAEALEARQRRVNDLLRLERGVAAALERRARLSLRIPANSTLIIDGEEVART